MTLAPALYVVATPLGNLDDASERLRRCLRDADLLYAEDTRRTRILLQSLGLSRRARSLHGHNERQRLQEVLGAVERGRSVAFVSDAGTPCVSDPGADLVDAAHRRRLKVVPVAGPSALAAALSVAGFVSHAKGACQDVLFVGFLPVKGPLRRRTLQQISVHQGLVALFEAPHRAHATLRELAASDPERQVCVCRELTKVHEEVFRCPLRDAQQWAEGGVLGELTLVLAPVHRAAAEPGEEAIDAALQRCLDAGLSPRDATTAVAAVAGVRRRDVYGRCQAILKEKS